MLPQNRCFVRSFRQFSSHVTKCHACHGICTLTPLDAALTRRCAKNTQHYTSKVLRLPREMAVDTYKVLRLRQKMQLILRKRHKSILRVPHETTFDTLQNTSECHEVPRLPRNEATRRLKPPKMILSAELTMGTAIRPSHELLRTVADGCERLGNVERTHPQPPNPQSETGTLATHSGKKCQSRQTNPWKSKRTIEVEDPNHPHSRGNFRGQCV